RDAGVEAVRRLVAGVGAQSGDVQAGSVARAVRVMAECDVDGRVRESRCDGGDDVRVGRGVAVGDVVGAMPQRLRELEQRDAVGAVLDVAQVTSVIAIHVFGRRRLVLAGGSTPVNEVRYGGEGWFVVASKGTPDGGQSEVHYVETFGHRRQGAGQLGGLFQHRHRFGRGRGEWGIFAVDAARYTLVDRERAGDADPRDRPCRGGSQGVHQTGRVGLDGVECVGAIATGRREMDDTGDLVAAAEFEEGLLVGDVQRFDKDR